jgi:hypothetical protein
VPPRWLAGELAAAQKSLGSYRPEELVGTLVSLARMGRSPGAGWMAALEEATRLEEFTLQVRGGGGGVCGGAPEGGGGMLRWSTRAGQWRR